MKNGIRQPQAFRSSGDNICCQGDNGKERQQLSGDDGEVPERSYKPRRPAVSNLADIGRSRPYWAPTDSP